MAFLGGLAFPLAVRLLLMVTFAVAPQSSAKEQSQRVSQTKSSYSEEFSSDGNRSYEPHAAVGRIVPKRSQLILTQLLVINRHGHRSPNAQYWSACPRDAKNKLKYDVGTEDLTGLGMQEEFNLGVYLRHKYSNFIGPRFNRSRHLLLAVGEPRILQSAQAVSQGLFPEGFGPSGYLPRRPQFVPVFSDMSSHEYLLDDVPCFRRAEADMHSWLNSSFAEFIADPEVMSVVTYMKKVCGVSGKDHMPLYVFLKLVADGMTFNSDFGLSVCKGSVTSDMLFKIRKISLKLLMGRLYSTDEQQTYTAVDLPHRFLHSMGCWNSLNTTQPNNDGPTTGQDVTFYFVHREALYALGQFFGFQYNVPGLPRGELPVASTLIFERLVRKEDMPFHRKEDTPLASIYVRLLLWTPKDGTSTVDIPACHVPQLCTLEELLGIYVARVQRTGTWSKLCNYTPVELDHTTDIR
ncbi:putative acid phosphatase [Trypanosoma vivax]|uniref:Putative acid phosphatase n=1 Tax=Trypanosoma vivax (strain Y486) TaxID=1055687 RepID=G0U6Z0_TRYVY|nr:putative acid phosphatase [Trypanosoma vivax]CCC51647.1 putative acid phosphatase [Trypanosoma vivax Y486]